MTQSYLQLVNKSPKKGLYLVRGWRVRRGHDDVVALSHELCDVLRGKDALLCVMSQSTDRRKGAKDPQPMKGEGHNITRPQSRRARPLPLARAQTRRRWQARREQRGLGVGPSKGGQRRACRTEKADGEVAGDWGADTRAQTQVWHELC